VIVRKAACIALGCLCEWLPEECATRHSTIVPVSPTILLARVQS
jgi:hypothetical protein